MERLELALRFIGFMVKVKASKSRLEQFRKTSERYRFDTIHAASLENNPLCSPVERSLRVYLPPGYSEQAGKRYPVVYFLHGYGSDDKNWTVTSRREIDQAPFPLEVIPKRLAREFNLDKVPDYERLDDLIIKGEVEPFILVQPDGSLHLRQLGNAKNITGSPKMKGSFYVNSPHSGNFADYIARDVVAHVDRTYRTVADPAHRAISGVSMGGYGTLHLAIKFPDVFGVAAALAPGNLLPSMVDWKLYTPLNERILGRRYARKYGEHEWKDIFDTTDMIYSKDAPLLPSIKRDEAGKMAGASEAALANWRRFDLNAMISERPEALRGKHVFLYCDAKDEFGLCPVARQLHETLLAHGIPHEFDNPDDPAVAIAPHALGCGVNITNALEFCCKAFLLAKGSDT
jgi:S-formylglutathione hydrolase FrmB